MSVSRVLLRRLGANISYQQGLIEQNKAVKQIKEQLLKTKNEVKDEKKGFDVVHTILTLQHSPVYTVGNRQQSEDLDELEQRLRRDTNADFVRSQRGGLITFHGPGQLVVYPVLHLPSLHKTKKALLAVKWYVNQMEQLAIDTCSALGVPNATRSPHTGVWIGDNKICALGLRNEGGVVWHGLALNCDVDLEYFEHIVPCGIEGKGVTSLSLQLGRQVEVDEVEAVLLQQFQRLFNCQIENVY